MAIITLTSDIGTKDYVPGAIKGNLLSVNTSFIITDISHDISPFNLMEAVYIIRNSYHAFPKHSWHLLLINLFDGPVNKLILAFHKGHYFACADNGLLPMIFEEAPEHAIFLPSPPAQENTVSGWVYRVANAINAMENGMAFHSLGHEAEQILARHNLQPVTGKDFLEGRIIFIDKFENVVVNITRHQFETLCRGRKFKIRFVGNEAITKLSNTYADVAEGTKLAFFNNAGYLEIAVNKGNAAGLFGLQQFSNQHSPSAQSKLFYQTVRVLFE